MDTEANEKLASILVEEGTEGTVSAQGEEDLRASCKRCRKKMQYQNVGGSPMISDPFIRPPGIHVKGSTLYYCDTDCLNKDLDKTKARQKLDDYKKTGRWDDREKLGAIGELVVCNDLMRQGYYAFRAVCRNGPVDIMAISPMGLRLRFDSKTLKNSTDAPPDKWKLGVVIDHYAVVGHDGTVHYRPPLPVE